MKRSRLIEIIKQELRAMRRSIKENVSTEAAQIHAMTGCGQDAAQEFADDNGVDLKKLVKYLEQNVRTNPAVKYEVKHYINSTPGTVGAQKNLRDRFIKTFKMGLKEVGPAVKTSTYAKKMSAETSDLYHEYAQKINVKDSNAINSHETLNKVMLKDPRVQKNPQKYLLQMALDWAITYAQQVK